MIFNSKQGKSSLTLDAVTEKLSGLRLPTALTFTPTNLEQERIKFNESDSYNPQFKYEIVKNRNADIIKELASVSEISDVDPRISDFYLELIAAKAQASDLMHSVGDNEKLTEISMKRFGVPSPILFRNASRVLRGLVKNYNLATEKKGEEQLEYEQIKSAFQTVFEEIGLDEWSADVSNKIAKDGVKVAIKRKQVLMDPGISRSRSSLRKTIVHEVGTHALRSYNGEKSGVPALGNANLPPYLDVEEGLATYNEEQMGLLTEAMLRNKAVHVWSAHVGQNMSFRELHCALQGMFSKSLAFDNAYRVKRGLSDTSKPGIYSKDIVYFRGYRRVKKKLTADESLFEKLYAGKIGFKQVSWVDEGLIPKAKLVFDPAVFKSAFKKAGI